jgi:HEAT repeat protein
VTGAYRADGFSPEELRRLERLDALAADGPSQLAELLAMRTDPSWAVRREVITALGALGESALEPLCVSLCNQRDDETRIAATVDALVASTGDVDAQLGRGCAGAVAAVWADVAQILGRRRNPASLPALVALVRHADDNVAVAAIEALGKLGGRSVVDTLVETVQSQIFFRTFAAIDVLGKSGDPRAVAPLVALLDTPHYVLEAVRALGHTCDRAAVAPLIALLMSPSDSLVRVAALALCDLRNRHGERFGTTAPIESAIQRAAQKPAIRRLAQCVSGAETEEQIAIYVVLGCLEDDSAAPALLRGLEGPPPVAQAAAEALERLSSDFGQVLVVALSERDSARRQMLLPRMSHSRATDAVIACLTDQEAVVRRLACEALARIGSRRAVPDLFDTLRDANPGVVQAATTAIIALGHEETLAVAAASSDNSGVRRAALRILSHLGTPVALEVLASAARDQNPRIREAAIIGLGLFEQPEAQSLLLDLASDDAAATRGVALRALADGGWCDERVTSRLTQSLSDPDAWVRYYACQAVGKLMLRSHVHALAARLGDEAGQVRIAAIEALSHLPEESAFAALLAAAGSDEIDVRRAALMGLGLSPRPEAIDWLLSNAGSDDVATRLIALSGLARLDAPEGLGALARAAHDGDESVRVAAIGYLAAGSSVEATQMLARWVTDPVLGARARAALSTPNERRVSGLSAALQTADDEAAVVLAGLLARLNQPDAISALFEAVTIANVAARRAAATALGALRTREALATLQRLSREDPDAEVRRVCVLLLSY